MTVPKSQEPVTVPKQATAVFNGRRDDDQGVYAPFIALIASALLLFGGVAYDAPRLVTARQHALHKANEAAGIAAATIISGGSGNDARAAVERHVAKTRLIYGYEVALHTMRCVGSKVEVTLVTGYVYRSAVAVVWKLHTITATAAAEARTVGTSGTPTNLWRAGQCII